jgi:hypothetical protein
MRCADMVRPVPGGSPLFPGGGNLPVVIIFVDLEEHVPSILPKLKKWLRTGLSCGRASSSNKALSIDDAFSTTEAYIAWAPSLRRRVTYA